MANVCFIVGNGLSMALSREFSLKKITETFINNSPPEDKAFLQQIANCSGTALSFDDFETNFAAIEVALDSVVKYQQFIETPVGNDFLAQYHLNRACPQNRTLKNMQHACKYMPIGRSLELG